MVAWFSQKATKTVYCYLKYISFYLLMFLNFDPLFKTITNCNG
jgi:hypothetical protein